MNPLSSKVHFLAQTRQTKRRTNRTGRTENQHERDQERATSFAHAQTLFSSVARSTREKMTGSDFYMRSQGVMVLRHV